MTVVRSFALAVAASLVALVVAGVALVMIWPFIRPRVVADLNAELRSQGVAKGAGADALRGLVDAAKALRN